MSASMAAIVIALLIPAIASPYVTKVLIIAGIYVGLACSLNVVFGIAGQLNLGQAAFYGIGAYTSALLSIHFHIPFFVTLIAGALMAAGAGFLLALPTIRLKGIYLAVTTLAFGEIIRMIFLNWISVTRGPMGIAGIPVPSLFGFQFMSNFSQYYLMLGLLLPALYIMWRLSYSPFGMVLRAVRENEEAAQTLGVNAQSYKVKAFVVGSAIAGLLGAFFSFHAAYISPSNFSFMESITLLSMVVFGGLGSMPGVIVAALLLAVAPDVLRFMDEYRMIIYGVLLFMMVLLRPQGIISETLSIKWAARKKRKAAEKQTNQDLTVVSSEGGG
ncbi:hypothetical protein VN24_23765 [Paenibacillus beijingensis]|uniref:Branched-chain amino acid ABC transporter permease n=2 Tax=Paenibacillus beijingensis TaxID=1126833 RepID=A0A0D5NRR5_9BACL|nr:hypothetical protein VN24_23765 [Paenibacillus beijingensis]